MTERKRKHDNHFTLYGFPGRDPPGVNQGGAKNEKKRSRQSDYIRENPKGVGNPMIKTLVTAGNGGPSHQRDGSRSGGDNRGETVTWMGEGIISGT